MTDSKFTNLGSGPAVKVSAGAKYMMNVFELVHIQSSLFSLVKKSFMNCAHSRPLFRVPHSEFLPFSP
ncbi:uncharacterized protein Bfra_012355 [Botrytis fragariae]|uniref:Uncharacterized protein n=1 Tax=Botrytis fragariae TaxID=1964551 RepID=A0A8H6AJI1_9HELO|nr:uncharacterized protein Bfra_012355 [Botrytis fragariae]KAF5868445.1 hypothetical protein Bfra_012355 [Botrytis fragariae]